MKKKIVGIFVMTLLIGATVLPVAGSLKVSICSETSRGVIDQEQPNTPEIHWLDAGVFHWQEFVNQGNMLEEVTVHIGNYYTGSKPITLAIQQPLGDNLTHITHQASALPYNTQDWFTFNVPDIKMKRGQKYYITIYFNPDSEYAWSGSHNDPYPTGGSSHPDADWDYAFKTIVDRSRPRAVNPLFLNFLQNHPNLFPILQKLLQRLGLR